MREVGIDISGQHSKDVVGFLGQHFPHIINGLRPGTRPLPDLPRYLLRRALAD
jgi:hypothetical protein